MKQRLIITLLYSHLLLRHPQTLERLREEIRSVNGNNANFGRQDLKKMAYLANILKESMPYKILFFLNQFEDYWDLISIYSSPPISFGAR